MTRRATPPLQHRFDDLVTAYEARCGELEAAQAALQAATERADREARARAAYREQVFALKRQVEFKVPALESQMRDLRVERDQAVTDAEEGRAMVAEFGKLLGLERAKPAAIVDAIRWILEEEAAR